MARLIRKQINTDILRKCREQMALGLEDASKRADVSKLEAVEAGEVNPTLGQLGRLAYLYQVPRWVFSREELPEEYRLDLVVPEFRKFAQSQAGSSYRTRKIISNVLHSRDLILSLRDEELFPIEQFSPPNISGKTIKQVASSIRDWLGVAPYANHTFDRWRGLCEKKDIFVLTTSNDWSYASKDFRGIAIYKEKLPMIIINNSDYLKAQSFTLFHELGHLLLRKSNFDGFDDYNSKPNVENWCDRFASEFLMPRLLLDQQIRNNYLLDSVKIHLSTVKNGARRFKVSPLAYATSLRVNGHLTWEKYNNIRHSLTKVEKKKKEKYRKTKEKNNFKKQQILEVSSKKRKTPRKTYKSTLRKYGNLYVNTLIQAYYDEELTLAKLYKLLDIKEDINPEKLQIEV